MGGIQIRSVPLDGDGGAGIPVRLQNRFGPGWI